MTKYLFSLFIVFGFGCGHKPAVVVTNVIVHIHYPKVVYNSCSDVYAVMTDSVKEVGAYFFGKEVPIRFWGGAIYFTLASSGVMTSISTAYVQAAVPPPPPPDLVVINKLRDTLRFTKLGGEFQFKDSLAAMKQYLAFAKECKDSEDIVNAPIRVKIKHYWDSAHAKDFKDSVADRKQFVIDSTARANAKRDDSIFKCQHTYQ